MKRLSLILLALAIVAAPMLLSVSAHLTQGVVNLARDCAIVKTARVGQSVTFCDDDVLLALGVTDYPTLTVLTLPDPSEGTLKLDGLRVSLGQTVSRAQIERLTLTPATPMTEAASFTIGAGNLAGGAPILCKVIFCDRQNQAPTAGRGEINCISLGAKRNISVFGTLSAYDPEGDALTYLIISYPKRGSLTITDKTAGAFRYTPRAGYRGTDTFTYVVRDAYGAYSSPSTVTLRVARGTVDYDPA